MSAKIKVAILTDGEIERGWWWRRLVFIKFNEREFTTHKAQELVNSPCCFSLEFRHWQEKIEMAAWRYELVRRLRIERQLPPWIELSIAAHCVISEYIGKDLSKRVMAWFHKPQTGPEWSKPMPPFQWNLNASDSALTRQFLGWIRDGKRKKHRKEYRTRKVSWRWPEVIDLHRWGGSVLSQSERSAKSDAEQEARKWEPLFQEAWETLKSPAFIDTTPADYWKKDHRFARLLRENFEM